MSEVLVDQIKMSCLVRKLTGYVTYTRMHNTLSLVTLTVKIISRLEDNSEFRDKY